MLTLLTKMGACFPYIRPEFLLEYHTYEMYMKHHYKPEDEISPLLTKIDGFPAFINVSKQSWCDVILQTYKVVCLQRLQEQTTSNQSTLIVRKTPMLQYQKSLRDINSTSQTDNERRSKKDSIIINVLGKGEITLISWMEFHFNSMKGVFWSDLENTEDREVDFFGKGLTDGLVFAAITGTYCPYLKDDLLKMYTNATTNEEGLSNNIRLIKCWEKINYSFKVTPQDLNRPRSVKLLMLVTYLYEVMPFMYPAETIEIKAGLSQTSTIQLNVNNTNNFKIAYKAIFFSNDMNCFSIDESIYEIQPRSNVDINIDFHAKFAKPTCATLLLSGEVRTYHYAKNKTITLLGIPDLDYMTSTIKLINNEYSVTENIVTVKAPYQCDATFDIKVCTSAISTPDELDRIIPYKSLEDPKYHRLMPLDTTLVCRNGVGKLKLLSNALSARTINTKLYFTHSTIGEFAILVISKAKTCIVEDTLTVKVPKVMHKYDRIYMEIPSRNQILWKCFKECLLRVTTGNNRTFWEKNIDSASGMHLCHALVLSTVGTLKDFCNTRSFKLIPDKDYGIQFPEEVTLQDVCSMGHTKVGVTFSHHLELPVTAKFLLQCIDDIEPRCSKRYYLATFEYGE